MLSLRADVQAKAGLASQISMKEAERLLADTTMYTVSSLHKEHKYVFGFTDIFEDPGSQEPHIWVLLGMLAFLWLTGCILMCVCLCCNKDDKFFAEEKQIQRKDKDQGESEKLLVDDQEKKEGEIKEESDKKSS